MVENGIIRRDATGLALCNAWSEAGNSIAVNSHSDQKSRGVPFCLACEISALGKPHAMVVP